ncbi:hypothetical protein WJX72_000003 [[Myrmecia] bisecta]|uniref:Uncharacterized protein n=1 Tax=[Myrmecia] bisecta TaxID=41462 RepID=A0AAW1PVG7_9CHLO
MVQHRIWAMLALILLWVVYNYSSSSSRHGRPVSPRGAQSPPAAYATTLNRKIAELNLVQYKQEELNRAFRLALASGGDVAHSRGIQFDEHSTEFAALLSQVKGILGDLALAQPVVDCSWDPTLHTSFGAADQKYLVAADMHNNEAVLPHYIIQLVHLMTVMPQGSTFLSVYESGSTDSTGAWLEVLISLIASLRVPHRIVIGGSLTRAKNQDRIDFLAAARNRALEPLWLNTTAVAADGSQPHAPLGRQLHSWTFSWGSKPRPLWPASRVVFLNDVYFCARDVVRLLQHEGDMVCGMDFDRPRLQDAPRKVQRRLYADYMKRTFGIPRWLGMAIGLADITMQRWRREGGPADDAFQRTAPLSFYDIWVARDTDGNLFLKNAPYVTDPYSLTRVADGLPFPVKCCWNGLVVMNALPFVRQSLRVRMHREGECAASECSLVCNDMLRMGYSKFLVDPGVRQAYRHRDAVDLYDPAFVVGMKTTQWADVVRGAQIDWDLVPLRPYYKCCSLKPGANMIEFDKDCHWDNFLTPNYTAMPALTSSSGHKSSEPLAKASLPEAWWSAQETYV